MILARRALINIPGATNQVGVVAFNNAAIIDQAGQYTNGVSSPAETKQINSITGCVVLDDVPESIQYILVDSATRRAGSNTTVIGAEPPIIKHMLFLFAGSEVLSTLRALGRWSESFSQYHLRVDSRFHLHIQQYWPSSQFHELLVIELMLRRITRVE